MAFELAGNRFGGVILYLWFDRPIALLVNGQFPHHADFARLTHIRDPIIPLAVAVFVSLGLLALSGWSLSKIQTTAFVCSISLIVAEATKNQLKVVFGRTWPETWVQQNPSFIRGGVYGFYPFHGGAGYESFPSGHSAITWL